MHFLNVFVCALLVVVLEAQQRNVYKSGTEGYNCFRIPALVTTSSGVILAFAEGRRNNCSDTGAIDIVLKRSYDDGKTWSHLQLVKRDSHNTSGNPAPVVEYSTGRILLVSSWNLGQDSERQIVNRKSKDTRRIFVQHSDDDGVTWSNAKEITQNVKKDTWTWYATGPGHGIQVMNGPNKSRLVIPCNHNDYLTRKSFSHVIYSDDKGESWQVGGVVNQEDTNESAVAELDAGNLMLNMRGLKKQYRQVATSTDGGVSWSTPHSDISLIEPSCEGNLISVPHKYNLAFSNPASSQRSNMTLRLSIDYGQSWIREEILHHGPSAYSCMNMLTNNRIGILFEAGQHNPYEGLVYTIIGL
jgi:sialidase-1